MPSAPPSTPPVLSIGTPSTTYKGSFDPVKELPPRIVTFDEPPAPLPLDDIFNPETWPLNASNGFTLEKAERLFPSTLLTAYPNAFLSLFIPNAVTTTSSNC